MVHRVVILVTAMTGPQPSARASADHRTMRLALELLERTAGRPAIIAIRYTYEAQAQGGIVHVAS